MGATELSVYTSVQRESDGGVGVALAGRYSGECNPRVRDTWLGQLWAWSMSAQRVGLRLAIRQRSLRRGGTLTGEARGVVAQAMRYAGCPNRRSLGFKRSVPPGWVT